MAKKKKSAIKQLADALAAPVKPKEKRPAMKGKLPKNFETSVVPYQFKPGQIVPNRGRPKDHAKEVLERLASTSPPKELCDAVGIDPDSTWIEAIVYVLGTRAMEGDVNAAREILSNLGLRGYNTPAKFVQNNINLGDSETPSEDMGPSTYLVVDLEDNPDLYGGKVLNALPEPDDAQTETS